MGLGGFLKGLGKGALKFGGVAAAPFTGGASMIPTLLSTGGAIASGIAGGRAAGREREAGVNQNQDRLRLQAARLNLEAPQQYARNSVRGDLLANLQPASLGGSGRDLKFSGGLNPSVLSDTSRQLGQNMSRDALLASMKGDAFTPTPLPQAGKLDSFLNIAGPLASGLGMLGGARSRPDSGGMARPSIPQLDIAGAARQLPQQALAMPLSPEEEMRRWG